MSGSGGLFGFGGLNGGSMSSSHNSQAMRNNVAGPVGGTRMESPSFGDYSTDLASQGNLLDESNLTGQANMSGFLSGLANGYANGGPIPAHHHQAILDALHVVQHHMKRGGVAPHNIDQLANMTPISTGPNGIPKNYDFTNSMQVYYDKLNSGNMTPNAANGYAANFSKEAQSPTGLNFGQAQNNGPAIGQGQWDGPRKQDLINYSNANFNNSDGPAWKLPQAQNQFFNEERTNNPVIARADNQIQQATDPHQATALVGAEWEKPKNLAASMPQRLAYSDAITQRVNNGNPFPPGQWEKSMSNYDYNSGTPNGVSDNRIDQIAAKGPMQRPDDLEALAAKADAAAGRVPMPQPRPADIDRMKGNVPSGGDLPSRGMTPESDLPVRKPDGLDSSDASDVIDDGGDSVDVADSGSDIADAIDFASRGGRIGFADGGSDDLDPRDKNNGALGESVEFAPAPERRSIEEHYPKPDNGTDLYAIAHDPREEPMKRYGAMGAGMAGDIANGMWDQVKKPGEALRGEYDPSGGRGVGASDQAVKDAVGISMMGLGSGTAFNKVPDGAIGMFAGQRAKTADLDALKRAQEMATGTTKPKPYGDLFEGQIQEKPAYMDKITRDTGWHAWGPDGKPDWAFEIADNTAKYNPKAGLAHSIEADLPSLQTQNPNVSEPALRRYLEDRANKSGFMAPLHTMLDHPELYDAYPHLKDTLVYIDPPNKSSGRQKLLDPSARGAYHHESYPKPDGTRENVIALKKAVGMSPNEGLTTLLHEIQHHIQKHEDWQGKGDNWKNAGENPATSPHWERWNKSDKTGSEPNKTYSQVMTYLLNGGEAQSRNTQLRQKMTMEERRLDENHPYLTIPLTPYERNKKTEHFADPADIHYRADGGAVPRRGYATNGAVDGEVSFAPDDMPAPEESHKKYANDLPIMARDNPQEHINEALDIANRPQPDAHSFVQQELNTGEKQVPQYDPDAGAKTATKAALTGYGMTNAGGVQDALGAMPDGEGGYNPSLYDNIRKGNYADAGFQAMGALVPGAGGVAAKVAKGAKALKGADAVADAAKAANAVADTTKVGEAFKPVAPKIIRPNEIDTPTIRHILGGNGYTDIPESALFFDRMNEPARIQTPSTLAGNFRDAVKEHLNMSRMDRAINSKAALDKLLPYIGKKDGEPIDLLTQNAKLAKSAKELGPIMPGGLGIDTWGLSLSPAMQWGKMNLCSHHAPCWLDCLGKKSGGYALEGGMNDSYKWNLPRGNSMARTIAMMQEPRAFAVRLLDELNSTSHKANMKGALLGARLNTLSDLHPSVWKPFRDALPEATFYDYTKVPGLVARDSNHHLTHSSSGISTKAVHNPNANWLGPNGMRARLDAGDNVAVPFSQKNVKPEWIHDEETGRRYKVVDGDTHDFRPHDKTPDGEQGVIIGLGKKNQGVSAELAPRNSKGFYWDYNPKKHGDTVSVPDQNQFAKGGRVKPRVDEATFMEQFHNHDHFVDTGKKEIEDWWTLPVTKGSARKR